MLWAWVRWESGLMLVSGAGCGWRRREGFSIVTVAGFIHAPELELVQVVTVVF
jgi:hypothetical protein